MFKALLGTLIIIAMGYCSAYGQQSSEVNTWKAVHKCGLSFSIPANMTDLNAKGIDSCLGSFGSDDIYLSLDYGLYSGISRYETYQEFNETPIRVDGKKGRYLTYKDSLMDPAHSWVGCIYIPVAARTKHWPETAFNMFATVKDQESLNIAKKIFQSIRTDK